jgi:hypothetical protein
MSCRVKELNLKKSFQSEKSRVLNAGNTPPSLPQAFFSLSVGESNGIPFSASASELRLTSSVQRANVNKRMNWREVKPPRFSSP